MNRVNEVLEIVQRVALLGEYDSNVIGMAAEIIAEDVFGMEKVSRGHKDIDGRWRIGDTERSVQVKAWSEARIKKYKNGTFLRLNEESLPDDLLVLLIYCSKSGYEVLYNGKSHEVGYVENNSKHGKRRVIRFDAMKSKEEISQILNSCP